VAFCDFIDWLGEQIDTKWRCAKGGKASATQEAVHPPAKQVRFEEGAEAEKEKPQGATIITDDVWNQPESPKPDVAVVRPFKEGWGGVPLSTPITDDVWNQPESPKPDKGSKDGGGKAPDEGFVVCLNTVLLIVDSW